MDSRRGIAIVAVVAAVVSTSGLHIVREALAASLTTRQRETVKRISALSDRVTNLQDTSRAIATRLAVTEVELADLQMSLQRTEVAYDKQRLAFDQRLVEIYKNGSGYNFVLLANADDLNDLVVRMRLLLTIADSDQRTLVSLRDQRISVAQARDRMSELKGEQTQLLALQRKQIAELREELVVQKRLLAGISAKIKAIVAAQRRARARARKAAVRANKRVGRTITAVVATVDTYPGQGFLTAYDNARRYAATGAKENGEASWYGNEFNGRPSASGEMFNEDDFTAAHRTLPFGTYLAVLYGDRGVIVRITDRGPFVAGRFLDLSKRAAAELGIDGIGDVKTEIVSPK